MLVVVSPTEKAKIFNRNTHIGSPDSPTEGVQETLDRSVAPNSDNWMSTMGAGIRLDNPGLDSMWQF